MLVTSSQTHHSAVADDLECVGGAWTASRHGSDEGEADQDLVTSGELDLRASEVVKLTLQAAMFLLEALTRHKAQRRGIKEEHAKRMPLTVHGGRCQVHEWEEALRLGIVGKI